MMFCNYWFFFFVFFVKQKTAYEIALVTGVQTCALPIWRAWCRGGLLMDHRAAHDQHDHRDEHRRQLQLRDRTGIDIREAGAVEAEHRAVKIERGADAFGAEHHPAEYHEQEGRRPAPEIEALHAGLHAEHALDAKDQPVPRAPDEERPVRAMPETAEQHRQKQIELRLRVATALAAERV